MTFNPSHRGADRARLGEPHPAAASTTAAAMTDCFALSPAILATQAGSAAHWSSPEEGGEFH